MKLVVLYRPISESARVVETFMHDFQGRNPGIKIETQDADSRDGIALAAVYDIMRFPALLAVAADGSLLKYWEGEELPLMDEVASYAYSG